LGERKLYIVNVIDNVLVALFAIIGDGLAPFRAWDTYNMIYIVHYHRLSWKLRKKAALPKLENKNDLPALHKEQVGNEETEKGDFVVLTEKQQASLTKHQDRFSKSHTFYKPHETATHFAFPIILLITIVVLLDCHSLLQISLGAVTWGIDYKVRPFALTTVILCCSIACNITAGVFISIGDHRTRKKDVLERMDRQELTSEAIAKIERLREDRRRQQAEQENQDPDLAVQALPPKVLPADPPKAGAPRAVRDPNNRWTAWLKLKRLREKGAGIRRGSKGSSGEEEEEEEEENEKEMEGEERRTGISTRPVERQAQDQTQRRRPLRESEEAVQTAVGASGAPGTRLDV
jgi:hypothetical protein